jgi:hypothetical protein
VTRWLLGLAALPVGGYGGWLLLSRADTGQLLEVVVWLASGVVVHDLVVAGVSLLGGRGVGLLPRASRAPAAVALVVTGTLALVALPVLGGFGDDHANPTHLDRPYVTAWVVWVTVVAVAVLVVTVVRVRSERD